MTEQPPRPQTIHNALRSIPHATWVLTCKHEQFRDGIITKWVQQCSVEPPMLVVAIPKGRAIEPMLRDARAFALCMVQPTDKQVQRLFGRDHEKEDDPFLALTTTTATTGMPILKQSLAWFDCQLEGHLSPDADCRLYLGHVVEACILDAKVLPTNAAQGITPPAHEERRTPRSRSSTVATNYKE
jgi:flavin reductase (DIM6/NTAB) family NADH-FMN oxidoreductase RutF